MKAKIFKSQYRVKDDYLQYRFGFIWITFPYPYIGEFGTRHSVSDYNTYHAKHLDTWKAMMIGASDGERVSEEFSPKKFKELFPTVRSYMKWFKKRQKKKKENWQAEDRKNRDWEKAKEQRRKQKEKEFNKEF